MLTTTMAERGDLAELEGRRVCVALRGGGRIDDGRLVSAGGKPAGHLWLFSNGVDRFLALSDVVEVWEVGVDGARRH